MEPWGSACEQLKDQLSGSANPGRPSSKYVSRVSGEYDGHGDGVYGAGEVPGEVEGEEFDEGLCCVMTAAADFLHDTGDGTVELGCVAVFVWGSRFAGRRLDLGAGGEVGLVGKSEGRGDPVAGVELSGQSEGEGAKVSGDLPVPAD